MIGLLNSRNDGAFVDMISPVNKLHPRNLGLISRWLALPGLTGGSRLIDIMNLGPNGLHGTLTNMDPVTDWKPSSRPGGFGALDYDGSDDFVDMGNVLNFEFTDTFSLSAWVNVDSALSGSNAGIVGKGDVDSPFRGYALRYTTLDNVRLQVINSHPSQSLLYDTPANSLTSDAWHHVVMTYAGNGTAGDILAYIDGVSQTLTFLAESTITSTIVTSISLQLGAREGAQDLFNGLIDDVRISNRILSPVEILTDYLDSRAGYYPELNWIGRRVRVAAAEDISHVAALADSFDNVVQRRPIKVTSY